MADLADLADLNLNLLLALDALLSEANVTRAAERLGVTQPAMSRSLQKLRERLGDELLVRSGRGLVRTPRAERIRRALGHGLQSLRRALAEDDTFEPARATTAFRVAANDVAGVRLLPAFMARLGGRAPRVAVNVVPLDYADLLGQFEFGALDLALGVSTTEAPGLRRRVLLRDDWTCLTRAGHPAAGDRLDLEAYLGLPHALCSPRGEGSGVVDEALAALGRARRVTLRSRYFVAAALAVRQSDLVLTMPRRSGERLAELLGLRAHAPPAGLALRAVEFVALWHERMDDAPAHRWFRQELFAANDEDLAGGAASSREAAGGAASRGAGARR
jgi:DNA-binding transcriptional LysR family regulator